MKNIFVFITFLLGLVKLIKAQKHPIIQTSLGKVSHVILPDPIKLFSLGQEDEFSVFFSENILKINPLSAKYIHTNLIIQTKKGDYFSFFLENVKNASAFDYFIEEKKKPNKGGKSSLKNTSEACKKALEGENHLKKTPKKRKGLLSYLFSKNSLENQNAKVSLSILGLFVYENHMYFKIQLENKSLLAFHIESISMTTKSKVGKKKASSTLKTIPILENCDKINTLHPNSSSNHILVINNLTLAKEEELYLEVFEKPESKRHLKLKITPAILLKAQPLF